METRAVDSLSISLGPVSYTHLFEVDVQGAKIYVDGSEIDYTSPVEITYGKHTLKVTADGYDTKGWPDTMAWESVLTATGAQSD